MVRDFAVWLPKSIDGNYVLFGKRASATKICICSRAGTIGNLAVTMEADPQPANSVRTLALTRPLAFLDLETTGKVLGLDRIVEIGILKVMPEGDQVAFETRLNPEMRISKEATAIHGIGERDIINKPAFKDIAPRLADFLHGCDLAGYNILSFDLPMLSSEFRRVDIPFDVEVREIVDVLAIFVQKEPRDLKAAYRFYCGREYEKAHSAAADARACWEVLQGQVGRYADLPKTPKVPAVPAPVPLPTVPTVSISLATSA